MHFKPTAQLRIKREYDYVGYEERQVNIDTLQQLWVEDGFLEKLRLGRSEWRDVPIIEPEGGES